MSENNYYRWRVFSISSVGMMVNDAHLEWYSDWWWCDDAMMGIHSIVPFRLGIQDYWKFIHSFVFIFEEMAWSAFGKRGVRSGVGRPTQWHASWSDSGVEVTGGGWWKVSRQWPGGLIQCLRLTGSTPHCLSSPSSSLLPPSSSPLSCMPPASSTPPLLPLKILTLLNVLSSQTWDIIKKHNGIQWMNNGV